MLIDFPVSLSLLLSLSVAVTGNPIDDSETVAGLATEDATPRIYHGLDEASHGAKRARSLGRIEGLLSLEKRQQLCADGPAYGVCLQGPLRCCPLGGDCCSNGNCCESGNWCYSAAVLGLALVRPLSDYASRMRTEGLLYNWLPLLLGWRMLQAWVCRDPNEPPPPPPPPPPSSVPLPAPPPPSTTRPPPPPPSTSGTTRPTAIPSSPTRTTTVIVVTTPVGSSSPPFNPDPDFPSVQSTDDRVVQTTIRPGDIDPNDAPGIQAGGEESISKGHVIIPQGRLYPVLFCFFYLLL
ncbi:hypothetical protein BKA70DRAFT_1219910 [Coprinopsis sp. MPI-PUGE-AT-0042]|nr:hypothetical protein BKA70DRAFT_1219910 [Coprinopsis sp. MPI-PUGE-AT-0042]